LFPNVALQFTFLSYSEQFPYFRKKGTGFVSPNTIRLIFQLILHLANPHAVLTFLTCSVSTLHLPLNSVCADPLSTDIPAVISTPHCCQHQSNVGRHTEQIYQIMNTVSGLALSQSWLEAILHSKMCSIAVGCLANTYNAEERNLSAVRSDGGDGVGKTVQWSCR